jgi:thiol-disulfide isomerase/thioredoxin
MQFSNPHTKVAPNAYERELTRPQFEELLKQNTGNVIIKFGATWCGPCKRIEAHVGQWFDLLTQRNGGQGPKDPSIQRMNNLCIAIDVDDSFDLYGAFKSRRQVSGIPAILHFKQGNLSYIPDNSVVGADHEQVNEFFKRVSQ